MNIVTVSARPRLRRVHRRRAARLARASMCRNALPPRGRAAIITDTTVGRALWADRWRHSLRAGGLRSRPGHMRFPAGESHKRAGARWRTCSEWCAEQAADAARDVISSSRWAAAWPATWRALRRRALRRGGVPASCRLPTTLLAAVDASVGGKTAVDLARGEEPGRRCFHQPSLVLTDPCPSCARCRRRCWPTARARSSNTACWPTRRSSSRCAARTGWMHLEEIIVRSVSVKRDRGLRGRVRHRRAAAAESGPHLRPRHRDAVPITPSPMDRPWPWARHDGRRRGEPYRSFAGPCRAANLACGLPVHAGVFPPTSWRAPRWATRSAGAMRLRWCCPSASAIASSITLPVSEAARRIRARPEGTGGTAMNIAVRPGPLRGRVEIPASKSVAHRAMICRCAGRPSYTDRCSTPSTMT